MNRNINNQLWTKKSTGNLNEYINIEIEHRYQQSFWIEISTNNFEKKGQQSSWTNISTISLDEYKNNNIGQIYQHLVWTKVWLFNLNKFLNKQFEQK